MWSKHPSFTIADSKLPFLLVLSHPLPWCAGGRVTSLFLNHQGLLPSHQESSYSSTLPPASPERSGNGKPRNTEGNLPQPLKVPALSPSALLPPQPHLYSTGAGDEGSHPSGMSSAFHSGLWAGPASDKSPQMLYKYCTALTVTRWERPGRRGETLGQLQVN